MNNQPTNVAKRPHELILKLREDISRAATVEDIGVLKGAHLGKKSGVKTLLNDLGKLPPDKRKAEAEAANKLRAQIEEELDAAEQQIIDQQVDRSIRSEWIDLSFPGKLAPTGARHPLTEVERHCIDILGKIGFDVVDGPEVETPFRNFDALNIPKHHPARDMQDTFWLENSLLLRSHTSTVQVRTLEEQRGRLPIKIISPGRVYRNEAVDATHLACFHQFEGMWVDRGVTFAHLKGVLDYVVSSIYDLKDWDVRYKPKYYPYTEPSIGIDVAPKDTPGSWITIVGAGMVHPNVFKVLNYDPNEVSGFAFGFGISRMMAQVHGVSSMKPLYEGDLRVHEGIAHKKYRKLEP